MFEFYKFKEIRGKEITLSLINAFPLMETSDFLPCYWFDILNKKGDKVGRIDLRIGQNANSYYIGNIGYSIFREHWGHRYAAKACALLLPLAKRHGMSELLITCAPDNAASKRTCEIVGGRFIETCDIPPGNGAYREDRRRVTRFLVSLKDVDEGSMKLV